MKTRNPYTGRMIRVNGRTYNSLIRRNRVDDEECGICLEPMEGQSTALTNCRPVRHKFHSDCLFRWLRLHKTCPNCRKNLAPKTDAELAAINALLELAKTPRN
jgi:hypothetical protein